MSDEQKMKPNPIQLTKLNNKWLNKWISVSEALPPARLSLLVISRGDDCPAYGWMKFSAGEECPYFVVPQVAAQGPRGVVPELPEMKGRTDITHWFAPFPGGIPLKPKRHCESDWGLGYMGWEKRDEEELKETMIDHKQLREMQRTYLAASRREVPWEGEKAMALAEQISILAGHLADQMIPIAPPPPVDDEHVAVGCRLFSNPCLMRE